MDEDDESAALHQKLMEEARQLLEDDSESYIRWLIELEQELDKRIPVSGFVPNRPDSD